MNNKVLFYQQTQVQDIPEPAILNSKAYIPLRRKILASEAGVRQYPPMPEFCVGDTNMLVSENAKLCVTSNAKPKICISPNAKPNISQGNIGGVGSSGIGHVYFM